MLCRSMPLTHMPLSVWFPLYPAYTQPLETKDSELTQDAGGNAVGVEGLQGVQALAGAHELDGAPRDGEHAQRSPAPAISIHLGQDGPCSCFPVRAWWLAAARVGEGSCTEAMWRPRLGLGCRAHMCRKLRQQSVLRAIGSMWLWLLQRITACRRTDQAGKQLQGVEVDAALADLHEQPKAGSGPHVQEAEAAVGALSHRQHVAAAAHHGLQTDRQGRQTAARG